MLTRVFLATGTKKRLAVDARESSGDRAAWNPLLSLNFGMPCATHQHFGSVVYVKKENRYLARRLYVFFYVSAFCLMKIGGVFCIKYRHAVSGANAQLFN